ncbi:hypothetical protein QGN29_10575 [Temperatibacter marinus]|uniref:Alpha/beta hydrolase n=1 Tax=Temperatibacter marinus TaxID=1456591 RepID=A0AA52EH65_9PROT|nr:hypothetical protein [Temperatibacter marinus]WND01991.1 hypothetical protein QGN29_10575 [Temperatibacter marinus]
MTTEKPYKRIVYFLGGLLPYGPRYYLPFLKRGARQHSKLYDRSISFEKNGEWQGSPETLLRTTEEGCRNVETRYRFLAWDDLVKGRLDRSFIVATLHSYLLFIRLIFSGDIFKIYRYYWGFGNGIMVLAVMQLLIQFGGLGVGLLAFNYSSIDVSPVIAWSLSFLFGFFALVFVQWRGDPFRFQMSNELLRMRWDYAHGQFDDVKPRLERFRLNLKESLQQEDCDEFILVGHSYGSLIAVDMMADLLRDVPEEKSKAKKLGLVTLGSIHHFLAVLPSAVKYRKSLEEVGSSNRLYWFEPFIPQDGMNFPKCNPIHDFTSVQPISGPHQKSVKYKELVRRETYAKKKRDFWSMHFQYLKEGDYQGDYSYFRIICSDQPLSENYGLREKSKKGFVRPQELG